MLGSFNNCNIHKFSHKETYSEDIDKINQVVYDGISENMCALVQTGKYGANNKTYNTIMVLYVIKFLSEAYTLQGDARCDGKSSLAGDLVVKAHYMNCIQNYT